MVFQERLRFGIFEFHPGTRELWRDGHPVRLQAQPAQVLAAMLARPGEVISREELRQAVWGGETFVDFERGLNFCVAQVRSALGDSADSPRFVRTLPKRGYQFIAPVTVPLAAPGVSASPPLTTPRQNRWWPAVALALAAITLTLVGQRWWTAHSQVRIAVTRFDNETGDPALDRFADGLTDAVVADLTAADSGRYGVIGNADILRLPRNRRNLLAIASTLRAQYVVLGQLQGDPAHPRILAHLIRLPEQTHLWVTRREDVNLDDAARAQAETAARIVSEFIRRLASPAPLPK